MAFDFIVEQPKPYRKIYKVIDTETGELIFTRTEDNIQQAMEHGETSIAAYVDIDRKTLENGASCSAISDTNGDAKLFSWSAKPPKRRMGQKSYWKFHPERVLELPDSVQLALNKLIPFIRVDGALASRRRTRNGRKQELLGRLGVGQSKAYELFNALIEHDVMQERDDKFYINRYFVSRG